LERLANIPLFQENWFDHQRRDAYWKHGSVCEDYSAIQCPVYAVGGWTDGYTNAIPRLLEHLKVPRKGLIGPWAHAYPHFAFPGPQIGFLQEMLRWWDHWLKGIDTGVMNEPMLRAWMMESVKPANHHDILPGRWVAEASWPAPGTVARRLFLTDNGLREAAAPLTARAVCSAQTVGTCSGEWVPFGRGRDQANDQQEDDARSLTFETPPLDTPIEILGAPIVTLDLASDRPLANLVVRLCDLHPSGESLRVSYGVLNLTHREDDENPTLLTAGQRYRLGISGRPQGEACDIDDLLADDLARSGSGNADDFCRQPRAFATPAQCRRCQALGLSRTGDGNTGKADHHSSGWHAQRTHRTPESRIGNAVEVGVPRRRQRSAQRRRRTAPDPDSDAKRLANPGRDADATFVYGR
jgi:putative CocE/NonD family hydrolase